MADWFAKLMLRGHARARAAVVRPTLPGDAAEAPKLDVRDARYDSVLQRLRDREVEERDAREKRHRWYRQSLETDSSAESTEESSPSVARLYKLRTKVPCRATPAAQALLDQLRKRFAGCTISFTQLPNRRQAVMLTGRAGAIRRQIGWVEHCVQRDPELCNVRHQGLSVETDGGSMLVLRFKYPATSARICSERQPLDETGERCSEALDATELDLASVGSSQLKYQDFAEIGAALDFRSPAIESSPRLVWVTRPEAETMDALQSREYEAFYLRFKLEVQAGIWSALLGMLSTLPATSWQRGSCYTLVREPDASTRKIQQRTVDDRGHSVDIGQDRTYDAAPATDILLLQLDGDVLADFADIYFTLQSQSSTDAYFLKEEFFMVIRRFWTSAQSLVSRYGGDRPAVLRMAQRAVPMPAQAPMLTQDWTNLRQCLVDRYGEGGSKAADLRRRGIHRSTSVRLDWPFSSFPAGEVNIGLRVIYRQAWRHVGAQRGELIGTKPLGTERLEPESAAVTPAVASPPASRSSRIVETIIEKGRSSRDLEDLVKEITRATADSMKWRVDCDGSIHTDLRELAATSDLEVECRESSRNMSLRLSEMARNVAGELRGKANAALGSITPQALAPSSPSNEPEVVGDEETATQVYSRLRNLYEVLTRPAEIQNIVLVGEKLPAPSEINRSWVRRHDWILAKVLLDESFRDALETIGVDSSAEQAQSQRGVQLEATRGRLYEHIRANILHYQRAIWQQEDPQRRMMRYRKSGKKVPLEWQFELESGSELTIDELGDRLAATNVDGHFAAYSGGREADLDRLIDPAGLLGYHGNYAVFRMRPEFGADDLFSMLHFFKSPYLTRSSETGEPIVDDPGQILSDAVVTGPNDPQIAYHRDRARMISLETDGMVIDVVRSTRVDASVVPEEAVAVPEEPVRYELILDGAPAVELLKSNASPEDESAIVLGTNDCERSLFTAGVECPRVEDADEVVVHRIPGAQPSLCAGNACDPRATGEISASCDDATRRCSLVTGVGTQPGERVMRANLYESRCIGHSHDTKADSGIVTRGDRDSTLTPAAQRETSSGEPSAWSLGSNDENPASFQVGRAGAIEERVIVEPENGGLILSSITGGGAARAHERVILAAGDAQSTNSLVAGAGASNEYEHMVLAQDDEWLRPSLVIG